MAVNQRDLLVDPWLHVRGEFHQALGEPQLDLLLGTFNSVRTVDDVSADVDAEVTPDCARLGVQRVCCSNHFTACSYYIFALPHHRTHWSADDVLYQSRIERFALQVHVVLLSMLL